MKDSGKMIFSMAKVSKRGRTVHAMKDIIKKEKNTVAVLMYGPTAPNMSETGSTIRSTGKDSILGLTAVLTKVHGKTIICMVMELTLGPMVESMKASITWIRSTDMVFTTGPMAVAMKATGKMGSSMEKANIFFLTA
jgi:hypothetical protein